jgi:hypothetical protein
MENDFVEWGSDGLLWRLFIGKLCFLLENAALQYKTHGASIDLNDQ